MNHLIWRNVDHFTRNEKWGDWRKIDPVLIYSLDQLRKYVNRPVVIHCGYELRATGGYHPLGKAVDIHIEGLDVMDQYLAAERFDAFNGIGVYPCWNSPGLHLDTRPHDKRFKPDARWGCARPGYYEKLSRQFFLKHCFIVNVP